MAAPDGLVVGEDGRVRCSWCVAAPDYVAYHDDEWGVEVHDDLRLFEKLCLEGFQAGLSWLTILRKRPALRRAFAGFDPVEVARYDDHDISRLVADPEIVRHRGKITAVITNARAYLELVDAVGSLDAFVWSFAPVSHPAPRRRSDLPSTTPESTALSNALRRRGFRYVGPTTAYAFMQAMGLVDDHLVGCHARTSGSAPLGASHRTRRPAE